MVLDLSLPKLSGLEVLRLMKEDSRTCKMPVVILSPPNAHLALTECGRLGPAMFIAKPLGWHRFGSARRKFN